MTPEAIAEKLCNTHGTHNGAGEPGATWCLCGPITESICAALRERDARLLKLADEWDEHAESVWNEEPHTAADFTRCAKDLRALLEEAGK